MSAKPMTEGAGSASLDFDALSLIEENSYREGYADGEAHGKLHGTFEGRRLGTEKGFELWQELGQMEATAQAWSQSLSAAADEEQQTDSRKRQKVAQQLASLLALIDEMPMDNGDVVDIGTSLERIRAKYKQALLNFGIPTSADASSTSRHTSDEERQNESLSTITIKGRRVDTNQLHF